MLLSEVGCSWGRCASKGATHPTFVRPGGQTCVPRKVLPPFRGCPDGCFKPWTQALPGGTTLTSHCASSCRSLPVTDSEDDGESEAAKQLIQPIAEKIIAKYKAKEEEAPLLFFVAGEVSAPRAGLRAAC